MSHGDKLLYRADAHTTTGDRGPRNGDGRLSAERPRPDVFGSGHQHQGENTRRLAATLLHDFNNFLTPALMVLFELQEQNLGSRLQRRLASAIDCVDRARALARDLVDMPDRLQPRSVHVSIADVLQGLTEIMACAFGHATKITLDVAEDLPPVLADPRLLARAVLNLAFNSHDAMPDGGRLILVAEEDPAVLIDGVASLRIVVSDEGAGMDEETIRLAARPGFSSKPRGAGLGLSIVRDVVERHGGCMSIISVKGIGTTATLWLPVASHRSELNVHA